MAQKEKKTKKGKRHEKMPRKQSNTAKQQNGNCKNNGVQNSKPVKNKWNRQYINGGKSNADIKDGNFEKGKRHGHLSYSKGYMQEEMLRRHHSRTDLQQWKKNLAKERFSIR